MNIYGFGNRNHCGGCPGLCRDNHDPVLADVTTGVGEELTRSLYGTGLTWLQQGGSREDQTSPLPPPLLPPPPMIGTRTGPGMRPGRNDPT